MTERDHLDRRLAAALDDVLTAQVEHEPAAPQHSPRPASRNRNAWVTAAVGFVVVLLTVITIRAAADRQAPPATSGDSSSAAAATPTTAATATTASLLQQLPDQPYGQTIHTWTEGDSAATGPFDVTDRTVVIAGVCAGGGAISIVDVDGKPHTLRCKGVRIQQPFWKFNLGGGEQPTVATEPVHIAVEVLSGSPRFVVRAWSVDPRILRSGWYIADTSESVPEALRTCAADDLFPDGSVARIGDEQVGVVTITSRSTTDCAIRSWPAMRYLDADGEPVGSAAGMSLDSREGELNQYHEFPPARIEAGGDAYLIVDLRREARLEEADREGAAAAAAEEEPDPLASFMPCRPVPVSALRLTVSGTTITVPAPSTPAPATCENPGYVSGLNPVVTEYPSEE